MTKKNTADPNWPIYGGQTWQALDVFPKFGVAGYDLTVYTRSRDRDEAMNEIGAETCHDIQQAGGQADFMLADASTTEGIDALLEAIDRLVGSVDLLVNNAGNAGDPRRDNVHDLSAARFRRLIEDNLVGPFIITREVLVRYMLPRQSGVVVFLGTHNGQTGRGMLGQLGYGCAKTALSGLLPVLTAECGRHVRFGIVRAGNVVTESPNWQRRRQLNPEWEQRESLYTPAGVLVRPEDVARAIVWRQPGEHGQGVAAGTQDLGGSRQAVTAQDGRQFAARTLILLVNNLCDFPGSRFGSPLA